MLILVTKFMNTYKMASSGDAGMDKSLFSSIRDSLSFKSPQWPMWACGGQYTAGYSIVYYDEGSTSPVT